MMVMNELQKFSDDIDDLAELVKSQNERSQQLVQQELELLRVDINKLANEIRSVMSSRKQNWYEIVPEVQLDGFAIFSERRSATFTDFLDSL